MKRELAKRLERLERVISRDEFNFHPRSNDSSPVGDSGGAGAIDLVKLEKLCILHCTDQEIAGYFGVSTERIEQERQSPEFVAVMERGQAKGKIAIRRGQMRLLDKGSSMMAALLGRQVLGQREEVEATNGRIPVVVLPQIVPTKEDEIQEMALPNERRYRHGSS
jgi:hypothetical protein